MLCPFICIINETGGISPKTTIKNVWRMKIDCKSASNAETPISSWRSSWTTGHKNESKLRGFLEIDPREMIFFL
jgi:hypothetical protein